MNVFFVLSGFLITGILIRTKGSPHYFQSFYARRILRISPLYFVTLACAFLIFPALHLLPPTPASEQFPYWTYTYNWTAATGHQALGLVHFWSLAVEEQFYLVWPILVFLVPLRRIPMVLIALLGASFLFRGVLFWFDQPSRYAYFLTPSRIEDLCWGALAAWVVQEPRALAWLRLRISKATWFSAALFILAFALGKGFEANKWPALLFGTTSVCALAALAIVKSSGETGSRWWGSPVLRWLGTYSYGIYVFHQPIMIVFSSWLIGAPLAVYIASMAGAITLSCLAGWISFHAFERYFLILKLRFPPICPE